MIAQVIRMDLEVVANEGKLRRSEGLSDWIVVYSHANVPFVRSHLLYVLNNYVGARMKGYCYIELVFAVDGVTRCLTICFGYRE